MCIFSSRTVDLNTMTLIDEPTEESLNKAESEFEKLFENDK